MTFFAPSNTNDYSFFFKVIKIASDGLFVYSQFCGHFNTSKSWVILNH